METVTCSYCGQVFEGFTMSQALWNMQIHIRAKHKKEKQVKLDGTKDQDTY